jgi:hypothetical protein
MPVPLSDDQLGFVYAAAWTLAPGEAREGFLRAVAAALSDTPRPIGDGELARVVRAAFGSYFRPPKADHPRSTVRSRRRVGEAIA